MAEEKKVKPVDNVTVFATAKAKFVAEGEPMVVHSAQAEKLIKSGKATKDKPTAKK